MKNHYVYLYLREKDGTPYYVGKGTGGRYKDRRHNVNLPPKEENIVFIQKNISNEEACELEKKLILKYGRKDLGEGILHNQTNGGDGGDTSKSAGYIKWLENVARNPESDYIKNMSKRMSENNPMFNPLIVAKSHTPEARKKRGESRRGQKMPESAKEKLREIGKQESEERSIRMKNAWNNPDYRVKFSKSAKKTVSDTKNMTEEQFYEWIKNKKVFTYSKGFKRPNSRVKLVIEHFGKFEEFYGEYYAEKENNKNKSWEYYKTCSDQEFRSWIVNQKLLRCDGNKNPRIFAVIKYRALENEFY
jgi:hypothetical protein